MLVQSVRDFSDTPPNYLTPPFNYGCTRASFIIAQHSIKALLLMRMLGIEWGVVLRERDPLDRATSWLAGVVCSSQTQKALHLTLLSI